MVVTNGRVNAATVKILPLRHIVQRFAHAVQTLKLIARLARQISNQSQHRAHRVGIVRGELRVDFVVHTEQTLRVGNIRHIGEGFARVHWKLCQTQHLRAFDFRIPVRAFDQAHHDLAIVLFCQSVQMIEHLGRAWIVALHHHAQAAPLCHPTAGHQFFNNQQRQFQTLGLLGVNVQTHIKLRGQLRQFEHARHELVQYRLRLGDFITRMQGRQLNRNPRILSNVFMHTARTDAHNRIVIGLPITLRIGSGFRALAEHVIRIGVAIGL